MLDFANKPPQSPDDVTLHPGIPAVLVMNDGNAQRAIGQVAGVTLLNGFKDSETGRLNLTQADLALSIDIGTKLVSAVHHAVGYDAAVNFENGIRGHIYDMAGREAQRNTQAEPKGAQV